MLITNTLSSTMVIPSQHYACPTDCSCVSTTITCNNAIPDVVPDDIVEVVLVKPTESVLTPRRFCNVTWPNVKTLFLLFDLFSARTIRGHLFDCLGRIQTMKMAELWPWVVSTAEVFYELTNVTTLDLFQNYISAYTYTALFSVRSNVPR